MGANNKRRAAARAQAKSESRAAIATQYNIPKSAMANSAPAVIGRGLFNSKKEAVAHVTATKFRPEQRATFNGQALVDETVPKVKKI